LQNHGLIVDKKNSLIHEREFQFLVEAE